MALFEILAIGGGALVGHQFDRLQFLAQGGPLTRKGKLVKFPGPSLNTAPGKRVLVQIAAGATAGVGLATKSLALTGGGVVGMFASGPIARLAIPSKASAQSGAPAQPPRLMVKQLKRSDAAVIAAKSLSRRAPVEPVLLDSKALSIVSKRNRPPPRPPILLTRSDADKMRRQNRVLEGQNPFSKAQKLGVASKIDVKRPTRRLKRKKRLSKRRRKARGLVMDRGISQLVATDPQPLVGRVPTIGRRLAFG